MFEQKRKTNVQYVDVKYYSGKSTVVCKLEFEIDLNKIPGVWNWIDNPNIQNFLIDSCTWEGARFNGSSYDDCGKVCFIVEGKSKASGGDVFDENVGKRVALTRAQTMAFTVAETFYDGLLTIIYRNMMQGLEDLAEGAYISKEKCKHHVYELLKPYYEGECQTENEQ